jgi:hypothetical protein
MDLPAGRPGTIGPGRPTLARRAKAPYSSSFFVAQKSSIAKEPYETTEV